MDWISHNLPIILPVLAIPFVVALFYLYRKDLRLAAHRLTQTNTRLEKLFENCGDAVVLFDAHGGVVSLNRAAEHMYGWHEQDILGKFFPMVREAVRQRVMDRVASNEGMVNCDTNHLTATGGMVEVNVTWTALRDGDRIDGFLLVARDLTQVRRLEKELLLLNEHLLSLTTLSKLLSGSSELRPTIEAAVTDMMTSLRLSYCLITSVLGEGEEVLPTLRLGVVTDEAENTNIEFALRDAKAIERTVRVGMVAALPIRLLDKTVGYMAVIFRDDDSIDTRMRVLETYTQQIASVLYAVSLLYKERETAERMRELDRLRGDFLSMVSHELRTPLTCIKGFVDTMLLPNMQWKTEDQDEFMHSIKTSTEQALKVVEDLLSMQRAEYGSLSINCAPLDLPQLIAESCRRAQSITGSHSLKWSIADNVPIVRADAIRLNQVMDNLLSNAIKYSPLGGDIWVKIRVQGEYVEVSVTDNGIGIEPKDHELIFERFYRSDNRAARKTDGLGIGLAIVQNIVSLHGGKVWLTSTINSGSTFYFTLPI